MSRAALRKLRNAFNQYSIWPLYGSPDQLLDDVQWQGVFGQTGPKSVDRGEPTFEDCPACVGTSMVRVLVTRERPVPTDDPA